MSVGKRIYLKREMPDPEIMAQFKTIPASNTADVMSRSCAMNPRIRLVSQPKDQMMVGPAYTVKGRAGDNLTLHAALNLCQEGDVLVVRCGDELTRESLEGSEAAQEIQRLTAEHLGRSVRVQFVVGAAGESPAGASAPDKLEELIRRGGKYDNFVVK